MIAFLFYKYTYSKWLGSLILVCLWSVIETAFLFIFKRPGNIQACMVAWIGLEEITYV